MIVVSQHFSSQLIKIRINQLSFIEDIVFLMGFFLSLSGRDGAFIGQNIETAEREELVDAGGELLHGEGVSLLNKILYIIKETANSAFKSTDGFFIQIIFSDIDI